MVNDLSLWPFLIVVPHSTVPNWKREIENWCPSLRVVAYFGADRARRLQRKYEMFHPGSKDLKCHIVVTSYTTPLNDSQYLKSIPWEALIVDEGQRLKNDQSLLYKALEGYKIKHKVLMTGTPLQNNPRELFNLLHFLDTKINAVELEQEFGQLTKENVPRLHDMIRYVLDNSAVKRCADGGIFSQTILFKTDEKRGSHIPTAHGRSHCTRQHVFITEKTV